MMRVVLGAMGVLALVFALAVGVIVAQPHDDSVLSSFFASQGCSAPCFLGIHPGVTTAAEAIAILQAHPWVQKVQPLGSTSAAGTQTYTNIYWGWNGKQPDFVFDSTLRTPPYLHINGGLVQYIRLVTAIPYADAWFTVGAPSTGTLTVRNPNSANFVYTHSAGYFGGKLVFDTKVTCPVNPAVFWNAYVSISYSDGSLTAYSMPDYHFDRAFFRSTCPV